MRVVSLPDGWDFARIVSLDRVLAWSSENASAWPEEIPRSAFTELELAVAAELRTDKRRFEWTVSRYVAKALAVDQGICDGLQEIVIPSRDERPAMVAARAGAMHLSLSHSGPFAAAAIGDEPVGIDIEVIREIQPRAAHLFLTDEEAGSAQAVPVAHALLHFWCAKEAAWKRRSEEHATLRQTLLRFSGVRGEGFEFRTADGASVVTARLEANLIAALAR
jgi:phosphopantetheinyl transferase (holo-ACP synthase)